MSRDDPHRLILIRHGVTAWNREFRYQGSTDVPLSDEGEAQARRVALRLSRVRADRAISSPLSRALKTAEIASRCAVEVDEDLREFSFGAWEGRTIGEIEEFDGPRRRRWQDAPFDDLPEGAESMESIMSRTRRAALSARDAGAPGETTLIFAHGVIIRALLATLLKADDISVMWRMSVDNCSISVVKCWGDLAMLTLLNDTAHMRAPEDMLADIPI